MNIISCVARFAQCVMDNIPCAAVIALGLLFILSLCCRRRYTIPFKYYLSMFTLPIVILVCVPEWDCIKNIFKLESISKLEDILTLENISILPGIFVIILLTVSAHLIIYILLLLINSLLKALRKKIKYWCWCFRSIIVIIKAINNCLFVVSISTILLLIYTQLSKSLFGSGGDSTGSSASDLAICAAIIAAFATMYNVQRVSKQELTKNRQDWITTVRLETAKIISTFDFFKANYISIPFNNAEYDNFISNCKSLVRSCTKLRMFMNPSDTIAPMITAQLDAITNYCNSLLRGQVVCEDSTIQPIDQVNLHKSLMPWVQILLKAEWERVKDVLESREQTSDGFYSEYVYESEWGKERLEKYGIRVEVPSKDAKEKVEISQEDANEERKDIKENTKEKPKEKPEDLMMKAIIKKLFPGFKFCDEDKKNIEDKLRKLSLVNK